MYLCEGQKWDLEHEVRKRDWEVLPNKMQNTKSNQKIFTKDLICLRHEQHKTRFFVTLYIIFYSNLILNSF